MADKRLLLSLAHPDDESFGSGALIARLVDEGVDVSYICATKGDRGSVSDDYLASYGSVAATRDAELDCASAALGFSEVIKLGYGDSGMMGSPANEDPDCLWQADETAVTAHIVQAIRRIKPQVVLTFDPFGAYGHPDHIYMHRATTRAFHAAGDAEQFPAAGPAYAPQKLYYTNIPRGLIRLGIWAQRLQFKNPRKYGVNNDLDMVEILNHAPPAHAWINIVAYMAQGDAAAACHASQGGGKNLLVPDWVRRWLVRHQTLTRAAPAPQRGQRKETTLFWDVAG